MEHEAQGELERRAVEAREEREVDALDGVAAGR